MLDESGGAGGGLFLTPHPTSYSAPFHHVEVRLEPIEGLSEDERKLLGEALCAVRAERGKAWNAACDIAEAAGKSPRRVRRTRKVEHRSS